MPGSSPPAPSSGSSRSTIWSALWKKNASRSAPWTSRSFRNATRTDNLPDAPDAPYVVFVFHTVFLDGVTAVETVTTEREGNAWLIAGHWIVPVG